MAVLRAAIYPRVSSKLQEENSSLANQERICRDYCESKGYSVSPEHVYPEVFTGVELWDRPRIKQLRAALKRREIDRVIAHSVDRSTRSLAQLFVLIDEIERYGAKLEFATQQFTDDALGRYLMSTYGFLAEVEREKIIERTQSGLLARIRSGKPRVGNRPLYGYSWVDDGISPRTNKPNRFRLEIDPVTGPIVQRIFSEAALGVSLRAVAHRLIADGIPTATGQRFWAHSTVRIILRDRRYLGEARAHRWIKLPGSKTKVLRPAEEQIELPEGTIPALVDAETFERVQERLRVNKQLAVRNANDPKAALLRSFVRCAECKGSMNTTGLRHGKYLNYRCKNRTYHNGLCQAKEIRSDLVDAEVWDRFKCFLNNPEALALCSLALPTPDITEQQVTSLDERIAALRILKKSVATKLVRFGDVLGDEIMEEAAALDIELKSLQQERALLASKLVDTESDTRNAATVIQDSRAEMDDDGNCPWEGKRRVLARFKTVVWIGPGDTIKDRVYLETDPPIPC